MPLVPIQAMILAKSRRQHLTIGTYSLLMIYTAVNETSTLSPTARPAQFWVQVPIPTVTTPTNVTLQTPAVVGIT